MRRVKLLQESKHIRSYNTPLWKPSLDGRGPGELDCGARGLVADPRIGSQVLLPRKMLAARACTHNPEMLESWEKQTGVAELDPF